MGGTTSKERKGIRMAITPAEIDQLTFSPSKHGYDTDEVDNFLERLSGEVDAMLQKIADLKGRLNASRSRRYRRLREPDLQGPHRRTAVR